MVLRMCRNYCFFAGITNGCFGSVAVIEYIPKAAVRAAGFGGKADPVIYERQVLGIAEGSSSGEFRPSLASIAPRKQTPVGLHAKPSKN